MLAPSDHAPLRKTPRETRGGFALLITITLLAFLVLLLVSLASLTRVETQVASNSQKLAAARQNAIMALNIALGQLQQEAGPDQRVTARAEILDSGSQTLRNTVVKQPLWTGVWKTNNPASGANNQLDSGTAPTLRTWSTTTQGPKWLVSADPTAATPPNPSTYTGTYPSAVTLAKGQGTNALDVTVPLVPISAVVSGMGATPVPVGRYAYWVSDEGVKAKVNLKDPTYGVTPSTSFVQNQLHFLAPQAVPVNTQSASPASTGLLGAANTTDIRDQASLSKVMGLPSLAFVTGVTLTGTASTTYSPDATTHSYGVLADVKNGGLKTDLSSIFEDTTQYKAFLTAKQSTVAPLDATGDAKLFTVAGNAATSGNNTSIYIFGPRWQEFFNYYTLYKDTTPANGLNSTACTFGGFNSFSGGNPGTATPKIDMRAYNYSSIPTNTGAPATCPGDSYMPRFVGVGIYLSLSSEQVPTPSGQPDPAAGQHYYKLRLYAEPRIAYYNPYNVTLNCPAINATTSKLNLSWGSGIFSAQTGTVTVGAATVLNGKTMFGGTGSKANLGWATDPDPNNCNLTFAPGQIRVFGVKTLTPVADRSIQTFGGQAISGLATKNSYIVHDVGQSQWCYLANDKNATQVSGSPAPPVAGVSPTDDWVGLVNDNDVVTISCPAGRFRANNGRYGTALPPSSANLSWPLSGSTSHQLGRFYYEDASNNAAQSSSLGAISAIQSTTQGTPFCYFVARAKGIQQSRTGIVAANVTGNMPVFSSCDGNLSPYPITSDSPSMDTDFALAAQNPTSATEIQVIGSSPSVTTFWGLHGVARNASDNNGIVMADIPRQPMLSLGQFMHMNMRNSMAAGSGLEVDQNSSLMPVGGSLCNPFITLDKSYDSIPNVNGGGNKYFILDDNYMSNDALFDAYFLSSVPPASPDAAYKKVFPTLTAASGTGVFDDANIKANTVTLPNARMKFYTKNGVAPQKTDPTKNNYLPDSKKCAANLLLDGAFNVNSTSLAAWTALLSSPSGNVLNYLSNGAFNTANLNGKIPILRFPSVVSADGTDPVNTPFGGVHALTQNQITELATAIVTQVKTRGPFLSMADFINRRLDTASGFGFKGALQAAIDNTTINSTNIGNIGMTSGDVVSGTNLQGPVVTGTIKKLYAGQVPANTAIGIPGWLMQQDLVQAFSPVMTVRSDTFVIRTYGETLNPSSGSVDGKAWCEAVVQRVPDYVDQTDAAVTTNGDAALPANVNTTNQTFGRRFKVVSFRWLKNETDI